ncbi:MAG: chorismate mutase [Alphaproteobacteria bacterium]|nr:chorismate mutase [Alphaproteobacteria bacterium]
MSLKSVVVNPDKQALADLRAQIDKIDFIMHDLLRERAEVIDQVRKLKGKQHIYIRPGREAQMLRALVGRPQGKIPEGLVVRLWREMISSFTLLEGGLKVAVTVPTKGPELWDLARDYYGAFTPLIEFPSAAAAVKAVLAEKATIAVVPFPKQGEKDAWWPLLASNKKNVLTVFASMPFENLKTGRSNVRKSLPHGLVLGKLYPELTGDDYSFLALQCVHVPESEMKRLFGKAGYKVRQLLSQTMGRGGSAPTLYLVETEGYVGRNDTRLSRLRAMLGSRLQHLAPLGGYAAPLKAGRK